MVKLIVKDPKTGETRPMTQKSFDLVGSKRGFTIVGTVEESKSEMELVKDRLRAEKAAKIEAEKDEVIFPRETPDVSHDKVKGKPGPKPKQSAE